MVVRVDILPRAFRALGLLREFRGMDNGHLTVPVAVVTLLTMQSSYFHTFLNWLLGFLSTHKSICVDRKKMGRICVLLLMHFSRLFVYVG
jgi:hypothetical protein